MPIADPRDGFFYPILTLMMDPYITARPSFPSPAAPAVTPATATEPPATTTTVWLWTTPAA